MTVADGIQRGALVSGDHRYRYSLDRAWDQGTVMSLKHKKKEVLFIGLNPSTADAYTDDPTVRKLIFSAKANGYNAFELVNIFAYRATYPNQLRSTNVDIIGPKNKETIRRLAETIQDVVLIYGSFWKPKWPPYRAIEDTLEIFGNKHRIFCFGTSKEGRPKHPLYLSNETVSKLEPFQFVRV